MTQADRARAFRALHAPTTPAPFCDTETRTRRGPYPAQRRWHPAAGQSPAHQIMPTANTSRRPSLARIVERIVATAGLPLTVDPEGRKPFQPEGMADRAVTTPHFSAIGVTGRISGQSRDS